MISVSKLVRRRRPIVVPRLAEAGAPPGTLSINEGASRSEMGVIAYDPGAFVEDRLASVRESKALREAHAVLWINVDGLGDETIFRELQTRFGVHPLVLEDMVNAHQLPKADEYDDYVYIVIKMPDAGPDLMLEQVSIVIGADYVITVQERPGDRLEPVRNRLRRSSGRIRSRGGDYLGYAIVDAIIDTYYPLVDALNGRLESIETRIIDRPTKDDLSELHAVRQDLHALRRLFQSTREAVGNLIRSQSGPFEAETKVFLRDCLDHLSQLLDALDACRELGASLTDLYNSTINNRMNEVMTVLTLIATIFIPLSFIAGIYGMNFDPEVSVWNMPELRWAFGYPFALGLMLSCTAIFLAYFWRRGWIGGRHREDQDDETA